LDTSLLHSYVGNFVVLNLSPSSLREFQASSKAHMLPVDVTDYLWSF
jgi:hypothetical protein